MFRLPGARASESSIEVVETVNEGRPHARGNPNAAQPPSAFASYWKVKMSFIVMTSPSKPQISACDAPAAVAHAFDLHGEFAAAIWVRMARGSVAWPIICVLDAGDGVARIVVLEGPSWPAPWPAACRRPGTRLANDAVGAHAQALRSSRAVISRALPLAWRVGHDVGCWSYCRISMVTMRSPWSISRDMAFSIVVCPSRCRRRPRSAGSAAISSTRCTGADIDPLAASSRGRSASGEFADRDGAVQRNGGRRC